MAATAVQRQRKQQTLSEQQQQQQFYGESDFILIDHHNCHHQYHHNDDDNKLQQINSGNRNSFICRMIELEKTIFCLMFYLIETYYRPIINQLPLSNNNNNNDNNEGNNKTDRSTTDSEWYCQYRMPSKRIYGIQKAYKKQFEKKFDRSALMSNDFLRSSSAADCYLEFHRNHIDWQLVFASISGFPYCRQTNQTLARQLDFDSLFDIEDAITQSAYLLANARQHFQLIDNLVLNNDKINNGLQANRNNCKQPSSQYNLSMKDEFDNFERLIKMIENLIENKNKQMNECIMINEHRKKSKESSSSSSLLDSWLFFKRKSRSFIDSTTEPLEKQCREYDILQVENLIENLRKEINSWEELIDVINISKCSLS
ncbi:hypothetical protein DERP_002300 [Dermatophagoides pteronyssinus]|uniref:Uncharacterized protein n=1 Tax=Dermatophagoides pteronyssinus TaxID=6956 RepID=A0ABQ8JHD1_DERPT|nr:hypothetical protein DERP_002300 [Dermatophagoides pteronyssinus]